MSILRILRWLVSGIAFAVALTATGTAQTTNPFWNRSNLILIGSYLGQLGTDAYLTDRNLQRNGINAEKNPFTRQFVGSRPSRIVYFSISAGTTIGGAYLLHRTGHHKMARILLLLQNASEAEAVAFSW